MESLKKVVITGATSGIGYATTHALCASGRQVMALGRNRDQLEKLARETGAAILCADVQDSEAFHPQVIAYEPDILINNAGVGHGIDGLDGLPFDSIQACIDINITAPIKLTSAVIDGMRARNRGYIINLGSVAGLHTLFSALYGATKSAIHMFSQNLRVELSGTPIRVTEICPGRVESGFFCSADGNPDRLKALAQSGIRPLVPEDVADTILYAINTPPHVTITTLEVLPTDQAVGGFKMNQK